MHDVKISDENQCQIFFCSLSNFPFDELWCKEYWFQIKNEKVFTQVTNNSHLHYSHCHSFIKEEYIIYYVCGFLLLPVWSHKMRWLWLSCMRAQYNCTIQYNPSIHSSPPSIDFPIQSVCSMSKQLDTIISNDQ